ncbi:MAG TPA: hypothetical protein VK788_22885 [Terriglobales bacterium]|jgi:hypothetical protein|nr:hypothetical protein [Terriglobales bacterium]
MNPVEDLEQAVTLDQAQQFVDFDSNPAVEAPSSTQQLLDELLGRFEDDGSPMLSPHGLTPEFCADFDE